MGQYFHWMNFDRREKLDPLAHDSGLNLLTTSYIGAEYTEAALTLLEGDWAGEAVLFMGDYASLEHATNPLLMRICDEFGAHPFDEADETFKNVSGRFHEVKGRTEHVYVDEDNEYERPYSAPFDLCYTHPRYVINRTKREYIDRDATCVWYIRKEPNLEVLRFDPTPLLLSTCPILDGFKYDNHSPWVGDDVTASSVHPGDDYSDATRKYVFTEKREIPIYATDDQVLAVLKNGTNKGSGFTEAEYRTIRSLLR